MFTEKQQHLLDNFADLSDQLFEAGVISTDSFTGEIGEYVACKHFKLAKSVRVTKAIDGVCSLGKNYQVKSKIISSNNYNFSVEKLKPNLFDFLVLVYFDSFYNPLKIIRIPSTFITSDEFRLTSSNINEFDCIDRKQIHITENIQILLNEFAKTVEALQQQSITRSKRIVGDIGEFYACERLNLQISTTKNEKGIDARHNTGLTFEIKTRRVYESGRRKSDTRRLNNLVGKSAHFLIVVTLDRNFRCAGMWLIPMGNLINPKSANLKVVNSTVGTLNLIPSQISWLQTGKPFIAFEEQLHITTLPPQTSSVCH